MNLLKRFFLPALCALSINNVIKASDQLPPLPALIPLAAVANPRSSEHMGELRKLSNATSSNPAVTIGQKHDIVTYIPNEIFEEYGLTGYAKGFFKKTQNLDDVEAFLRKVFNLNIAVDRNTDPFFAEYREEYIKRLSEQRTSNIPISEIRSTFIKNTFETDGFIEKLLSYYLNIKEKNNKEKEKCAVTKNIPALLRPDISTLKEEAFIQVNGQTITYDQMIQMLQLPQKRKNINKKPYPIPSLYKKFVIKYFEYNVPSIVQLAGLTSKETPAKRKCIELPNNEYPDQEKAAAFILMNLSQSV